MVWTPHATVATIVEKDNKFLFVEENSLSKQVLNQPAGHIERGETVEEAAIRETLEESGWSIELTGFVGFYTYTAPSNGTTYFRFCYAAKCVEHISTDLDPDIIGTHWLSAEEFLELPKERLRSPLVTKCLRDYLDKTHYPLDIIYEH